MRILDRLMEKDWSEAKNDLKAFLLPVYDIYISRDQITIKCFTLLISFYPTQFLPKILYKWSEFSTWWHFKLIQILHRGTRKLKVFENGDGHSWSPKHSNFKRVVNIVNIKYYTVRSVFVVFHSQGTSEKEEAHSRCFWFITFSYFFITSRVINIK